MEIPQEIIQQIQTTTLSLVKKRTGLERLSISERWKLNIYIRDAIRRYQEIDFQWNKFSVADEAASIFCEEEYGVPSFERNMDFADSLRKDILERFGYDRYAEYFQKRQDEANLI